MDPLPTTDLATHMALCEFEEGDLALLRDFRDVIAPKMETVLERFYRHLENDPEANRILAAQDVRQQAKQAQTRHWLDRVFSGRFDADYERAAAQIGYSHLKTGVDLRLFIGGYRYILQEFRTAIRSLGGQDPARTVAMWLAVEKAIFLDMEIAASAYAAGSMRALKEMALTDQLTRAPNRRGVSEIGNRAFAEARRHRRPLSVALFDLDRFKQVNDTYGHSSGDEVLYGFARCLEGELRASDAFGRWGGEEFLVLMPSTRAEEAANLLARVLESLRSKTFHSGDRPFYVTSSVGVACTQPDDASFETVVARADAALYAAKDAGRDRLRLAA
jgi:diguanylate cyclase (GGDEF)-like protein